MTGPATYANCATSSSAPSYSAQATAYTPANCRSAVSKNKAVATPRDDNEQLLSLDEVESLHVQRILTATGQNLSKAAEILGITRTTLYNKMRTYNHGAL
ncbi:MAG: helix-turn-helix domain-containing protein [Pyrinomonadaceae bacterium]